MESEFKWYILRVVAGREKTVVDSIKRFAAAESAEHCFEDFLIPSEVATEVKRGKKQKKQRNLFPGYVLILMDMNREIWSYIRQVKNVIGFLGVDSPQSVSNQEVENILKQAEAVKDNKLRSPRYVVGEAVKVIGGPFDSFVGTVQEVDEAKNKIKVGVTIFGRITPVELRDDEVEKQDEDSN